MAKVFLFPLFLQSDENLNGDTQIAIAFHRQELIIAMQSVFNTRCAIGHFYQWVFLVIVIQSEYRNLFWTQVTFILYQTEDL